MSRQEFIEAKEIAKKHSFNTLIMAACRKASAEDMRKLNAMFPELFREQVERNNSTDGTLSSD